MNWLLAGFHTCKNWQSEKRSNVQSITPNIEWDTNMSRHCNLNGVRKNLK